MTKEEREKAIDLLDNLIGMVEDNQDNDYDKALKMGIESLRKEPCADAVSREQALLALTGADLTKKTTEEVITLFNERIQALPLITPAQRWIPCSENGDENNGKI